MNRSHRQLMKAGGWGELGVKETRCVQVEEVMGGKTKAGDTVTQKE